MDFGAFGQKTGTAGPTILKLFTKRDQVFYKKNLENRKFVAAAVHRELFIFEMNKYFTLFS